MKFSTKKYLPEVITIILIVISFVLLAQRPTAAPEASCIHCHNMTAVSLDQDENLVEIEEDKENKRNKLLRYGLEKGVPNISLLIFHTIERFK